MKKNRILVLLLAVLVALLVYCVTPLFKTDRSVMRPVEKEMETFVRTNAPRAQSKQDANARTPPQQTKWEKMKEGLSALNDVPIVFFGRVEDQFANPVAVAEINGSIRVYNGVRSSVDRCVVTSDAKGYFQIKGGNGESLGVVPRKDGYVLATVNTLFEYSYFYPDSRHVPDAKHPVVIKMWKLQGAEPLVGVNNEYKLPFTNTPVFFDFAKGQVVNKGGDLKVVITRGPGIASQRIHGDWSIELVPVNGGIIESEFQQARVTFEAPADGYLDNYMLQMQHDDPKWHEYIQKVFFMKSRNGQVYSKFLFNFGINCDTNKLMRIDFKGVANTNCSRNWEATAPQ